MKHLPVVIKCDCMSSEVKFENHKIPGNIQTKGKVKLTDLLVRLDREKKQERKNNIVLSIATVSSVAVLGIILSL